VDNAISDRSLATCVQRFHSNDPVFATLERTMAPQDVPGLAVLAAAFQLTPVERERHSLTVQNSPLRRPVGELLNCFLRKRFSATKDAWDGKDYSNESKRFFRHA